MISDEGFATAPVRLENRKKCVAELRAIFAAEDLAHSDKSFAGFEGVWDGMRTARDIDDDLSGDCEWLAFARDAPVIEYLQRALRSLKRLV